MQNNTVVGRQLDNNLYSLFGSFIATFVVSLGLQTTRLYIGEMLNGWKLIQVKLFHFHLLENSPEPRNVNNVLEDDPMCGVTTGGMKECLWDCERLTFAVVASVIS